MVAAAALGTGCGGSSADPAPDAAVPDASVDAAMDAGLDASVCVPGTPFDINGRHAVELTLAMKVSASTVQEQPSTIRIYLLTDLNMLGTTGTATSKLCRVEIPEVRFPSASPMTFDASGAVPSVRSVSSVATVAGSSSCSAVHVAATTFLLGADVTPATSTPLPQVTAQGAPAPYCSGDATADCDPDPPGTNCACDQEQDNKPGATLVSMNIPGMSDVREVYASMRVGFELDGLVFGSNELQGTVITATEELGFLACIHAGPTFPCTAGDRAALRGFTPSITQSTTTASTFRTKRVPVSLDCPALLLMAPTLFP